ncbi:MAG: DNA repair protein RecN [Candidatus Rokubacteria bacterium]|nr:DNA repair protein RecN [Candidatus Rokubacteria bacterium]MBI2494406.1 DNA repair protein RecN [Candidatus Rokubacteria bacterium]MBI4256308.1 DNA repair protein RecN [Candidatus Rokubacteria bacterium]
MLRELRIRNFAVIESVTVALASGLNVLTGETGAGKSMLIDAILLVRGARAQADVIRTDAETATVEAVFDVEPRGPVAAALEEAGLGLEDGQLVLRREVSRAGRHRAFANDSPVTVGLLERLGDHLVEVHGQHEHQRLLEPARQLELLDRFADAEELRERVAGLHAKHREARAALERTRTAERDRAQREDLLRFQLSELDAARLRPGEEEELRAERRRLQHAGKLQAGLAEAAALLDAERDSALARIDRAARALQDLGRIDPAYAAPVEALEGGRAQLEDALAAVRALRDAVEAEPGRLEALDERLDALTRLERKYGDTEETMLRFRDEAAAELDRLARHEELVAEQERLLGELGGELAAAATVLAERRRAAAERREPQIERELRALGMERAAFRIGLERAPLEEVSARGLDRVELRLSTNPGEELRPLARVASGGELSRVMLALKAVLAKADRVPTLVFDEVDAGIGGRVASVVAQKLAAAAEGRQVLCVTHLAPIAAAAAHHVRVAKSVRGGRTRVSAEAVAGDARVEEIARMLGGERVTDVARGHARELLGARLYNGRG